MSKFLPAGQDRASLKWERPPELATGLTHAFAVVIPTSEVQSPGEVSDRRDERILWIPPAPIGQGVEVHVFLATPRS